MRRVHARVAEPTPAQTQPRRSAKHILGKRRSRPPTEARGRAAKKDDRDTRPKSGRECGGRRTCQDRDRRESEQEEFAVGSSEVASPSPACDVFGTHGCHSSPSLLRSIIRGDQRMRRSRQRVSAMSRAQGEAADQNVAQISGRASPALASHVFELHDCDGTLTVSMRSRSYAGTSSTWRLRVRDRPNAVETHEVIYGVLRADLRQHAGLRPLGQRRRGIARHHRADAARDRRPARPRGTHISRRAAQGHGARFESLSLSSS